MDLIADSFRAGPMTGSSLEIAAALLPPDPQPLISTAPDEDLRRAWQDYLTASAAFKTMPLGGTDEDHEPFYQAAWSAESRIEASRATTLEGLAIKLRLAFIVQMVTKNALDHVVNGSPLNMAEVNSSADMRWLYELLCDVERMAANALPGRS